jgi:hypothetical protein
MPQYRNPNRVATRMTWGYINILWRYLQKHHQYQSRIIVVPSNWWPLPKLPPCHNIFFIRNNGVEECFSGKEWCMAYCTKCGIPYPLGGCVLPGSKSVLKKDSPSIVWEYMYSFVESKCPWQMRIKFPCSGWFEPLSVIINSIPAHSPTIVNWHCHYQKSTHVYSKSKKLKLGYASPCKSNDRLTFARAWYWSKQDMERVVLLCLQWSHIMAGSTDLEYTEEPKLHWVRYMWCKAPKQICIEFTPPHDFINSRNIRNYCYHWITSPIPLVLRYIGLKCYKFMRNWDT